jgi:hypothetical protein
MAFADGNDIGKFNVFDLVDTCVDLWIDFLQKHGLVRIMGTTRSQSAQADAVTRAA